MENSIFGKDLKSEKKNGNYNGKISVFSIYLNDRYAPLRGSAKYS